MNARTEEGHPTFTDASASVSCDHCDAVCCRLTVVLMPEDEVPAHLTTRTEAGLTVMARDEGGWCVAVDGARMCCSIYAQRPAICRKFAMGGPYCLDERANYAAEARHRIPLQLC
ncbi:MAG: YkgJ family cysteine cluster protein [Pseudomonadota bacterium]|nr:YkgJ family cysteine cluster protein [Pseudomonadota bacterium]